MASTTTEEKEHPNTKATAPSLGFIKFNLILLNFFAAGIFCALVAIAAKLYAKGGSARGLQPAQVFVNQATPTTDFRVVTRLLPVRAAESFTVTPAPGSVQTVTVLAR